jgi:hypothetical protein
MEVVKVMDPKFATGGMRLPRSSTIALAEESWSLPVSV